MGKFLPRLLTARANSYILLSSKDFLLEGIVLVYTLIMILANTCETQGEWINPRHE